MDWLQAAQQAYESSTSYIDANYRRTWEDDIRLFNNQHPAGSKYYTDTYKYRSKLFKPKTRSMVRKGMAAAMAAFFSNRDVIDVEAEDDSIEEQRISAEIWTEVLNYRLSKSIPWYMICLGGNQDAQVTGTVVSKQYWDYEEVEETVKVPMVDQSTNQPMMGLNGPIIVEGKRTRVKVDKPCIELIPVENLRIDSAAKWYDPVNTSPYLIHIQPMYVIDVKQRMNQVNHKTGAPKWNRAEDGIILKARGETLDSTRQAREQGREDSHGQTHEGDVLKDYDIVWVHENFMRVDGDEYVYWTLATEHLLTDPVPIRDAYHTGDRPFVMGSIEIETHKPYKSGTIRLGAELQREANEITNTRRDNVKLVLNKRYVVSRGKQVDIKSLVRNVPGSVTMANDPNADVREMSFTDVTGSSYAEEDRLNLEYDELLGHFSQGSVQSNRKLNETVGGMAMIRGSASEMTDFNLRTFAETWVEPVLRQLLKLEQTYETDEVILALAAGKANVLKKYGIDVLTDSLLNQELTLSVNVGNGATDPIARVERFLFAVGRVSEIAQMLPPNMSFEDVAKEVFGRLGYKDGGRFFKDEESADPEKQQMMQIIQQLQAALESKQAEMQAKVQGQLQVEQVRQQGEMERDRVNNEADLVMKAMDNNGQMDVARFNAIVNTAQAQVNGPGPD